MCTVCVESTARFASNYLGFFFIAQVFLFSDVEKLILGECLFLRRGGPVWWSRQIVRVYHIIYQYSCTLCVKQTCFFMSSVLLVLDEKTSRSVKN